jgi:hypothetical protein
MTTSHNKQVRVFLGIVLAFVLISPGVSFAQSPSPSGNSVWPTTPSEYTLLEPLPCIPSGTVTCAEGELKTKVNFKEYVQYMFNLLIGIAAVSAVFMIVVGGFQYMTSDAYNKKSEGLSRATNAIYGLLLVLSSYLILKTIDPRLVEINETLVPQLQLTYNKNAIGDVFNQLTQAANQIKENSTQARAEIAESEKKAQLYEEQKIPLQEKIESLNYQIDRARREGDEEAAIRLETERSDVQLQISNLDKQVQQEKINAITTLGVGLVRNFGVLQVYNDSEEKVQMDLNNLDRTYNNAVRDLAAVSNPPDQAAMARLRAAKAVSFRQLQQRLQVIQSKK